MDYVYDSCTFGDDEDIQNDCRKALQYVTSPKVHKEEARKNGWYNLPAPRLSPSYFASLVTSNMQWRTADVRSLKIGDEIRSPRFWCNGYGFFIRLRHWPPSVSSSSSSSSLSSSSSSSSLSSSSSSSTSTRASTLGISVRIDFSIGCNCRLPGTKIKKIKKCNAKGVLQLISRRNGDSWKWTSHMRVAHSAVYSTLSIVGDDNVGGSFADAIDMTKNDWIHEDGSFVIVATITVQDD